MNAVKIQSTSGKNNECYCQECRVILPLEMFVVVRVVESVMDAMVKTMWLPEDGIRSFNAERLVKICVEGGKKKTKEGAREIF